MRRVGIYGGGQLGAYLCQAAAKLGLSTSVLAFTQDSMAKAFADRCRVAPKNDLQAVRALLDGVDVLTFELEDVPPEVLDEVQRRVDAGTISVSPSVEVMRLLQDKQSQKRWLQRHGLPTAEFVECDDAASLADIARALGLPFVQKANRGGYDGKGVQVIRERADEGQLWRGGAFAERYIDDKRELAVLVARGLSGEIKCYPVIEMTFDEEGNVLQQAHAPACISAAASRRAEALARQVLERLQGVGLFAIEMFLTADDQLLVNEISPRVHNTGHLTMEGHATSQYEQHLLAITGEPLGEVTQQAPAVMRNLLYSDEFRDMPAFDVGVTPWNGSTYVHWYGKQHGARLRKMGHVTALGADIRSAANEAEAALDALMRTPGEAL